mgnify:CR=1 FL=1
MNNFNEQVVRRVNKPKNLIIKIVSVLLLILVPTTLFLLAFATIAYLIYVAFFVFVGGIYVVWYVFSIQKVDFEYSVSGNELEIAKVVALRKRKTMCKVQINEIERLEKDDTEIKKMRFLKTFIAARDIDSKDENYFAVFTCFDFYIRFCRSFRTSFLPGGSLPAFRSPWCAGCGTSPENISRSDGHAIFKVQVRLQDHFSEKYSPLPYIQEVGKRAEKRRFPRSWTRPEKGRNLKGGPRHAAKTHHSGTAQRPARRAQLDAGTAFCGNRHFKVRAGEIRSRRF